MRVEKEDLAKVAGWPEQCLNYLANLILDMYSKNPDGYHSSTVDFRYTIPCRLIESHKCQNDD